MRMHLSLEKTELKCDLLPLFFFYPVLPVQPVPEKFQPGSKRQQIGAIEQLRREIRDIKDAGWLIERCPFVSIQLMKRDIQRGYCRHGEQHEQAIKKVLPLFQERRPQPVEIDIYQQHIRRQQAQQPGVEAHIIYLVDSERDKGGIKVITEPKQCMIDP